MSQIFGTMKNLSGSLVQEKYVIDNNLQNYLITYWMSVLRSGNNFSKK